MTAAEMADFIKANRKRELKAAKMQASIGYASGIVASLSLSKTRPRFEDLFTFPEDEKPKPQQHKMQMLLWAERVNRIARKQPNER